MGAGNSVPSIRQILSEFSDSLVRGESQYEKTAANRVFDLIRSQRRDVNRALVAGGRGKRTAISPSDDFDLVIFLNNKSFPLHETLHEIVLLLKKSREYENVRVINEFAIRFEHNGIQFDLSIALNLKGLLTTQRDATMSKIKDMDNPFRKSFIYSPSLSEDAVNFVKGQSAFTHSIIRLAKYWDRTIEIDGYYIGGRSLLMETIAIKAVRDIGCNDIFKGMERFFELMVDFSNLKTYFTDYYSDSYFGNEIPSEILREVPHVLDPVNPYNNLAKMPLEAQRAFSNAGRACLTKLREWSWPDVSDHWTMTSQDNLQDIAKEEAVKILDSTRYTFDPSIRYDF